MVRSRPSTSLLRRSVEDVKAGDKPAHAQSEFDSASLSPQINYGAAGATGSVLLMSNLRPSGNMSVVSKPVAEPSRDGLIENTNVSPTLKLLLLSSPTRRNPRMPSDSMA